MSLRRPRRSDFKGSARSPTVGGRGRAIRMRRSGFAQSRREASDGVPHRDRRARGARRANDDAAGRRSRDSGRGSTRDQFNQERPSAQPVAPLRLSSPGDRCRSWSSSGFLFRVTRSYQSECASPVRRANEGHADELRSQRPAACSTPRPARAAILVSPRFGPSLGGDRYRIPCDQDGAIDVTCR